MLSQKPYLIRAIYEWCIDNQFTPFLASFVDVNTNVPQAYVQNEQIIMNLSHDAIKSLIIESEWITFQATFGGAIYDIAIPVCNVFAIFAKENKLGMQFNIEQEKLENKNQMEAIKSIHTTLKVIK